MTRLPPQPWMTSASTRRVMQALEAERKDCARFVGGCVRNALIGLDVADIDIATQLTPDVVEKVMLKAGIAVHPTGIEHGTLTVVADHHPFEVTTLRRDVETDGRRATVAFTEDWAEDAQRRDFRINALYCNLEGDLFDPTGGGLADIESRSVVFVGDPEIRLREDYLRILRFFRFYAWYGLAAPDSAGLAACAKLKAGLKAVSAERIWMELKKLLAAPDPLPSMLAMQDSGVLHEILPGAKGLDLLRKVVLLEDALRFAPDAVLRFQSLYWRNEADVAAAARRLRLSNAERDRLVYATRNASELSATMSGHDLRRALYGSGRDIIRDCILLAWAGQGGDWESLLKQADAWSRPVMPVTGDDVMAKGVSAGPDVGAALHRLEAAWIDSDFHLSKEQLLARL